MHTVWQENEWIRAQTNCQYRIPCWDVWRCNAHFLREFTHLLCPTGKLVDVEGRWLCRDSLRWTGCVSHCLRIVYGSKGLDLWNVSPLMCMVLYAVYGIARLRCIVFAIHIQTYGYAFLPSAWAIFAKVLVSCQMYCGFVLIVPFTCWCSWWIDPYAWVSLSLLQQLSSVICGAFEMCGIRFAVPLSCNWKWKDSFQQYLQRNSYLFLMLIRRWNLHFVSDAFVDYCYWPSPARSCSIRCFTSFRYSRLALAQLRFPGCRMINGWNFGVILSNIHLWPFANLRGKFG